MALRLVLNYRKPVEYKFDPSLFIKKKSFVPTLPGKKSKRRRK
jgi:hypothetical protein